MSQREEREGEDLVSKSVFGSRGRLKVNYDLVWVWCPLVTLGLRCDCMTRMSHSLVRDSHSGRITLAPFKKYFYLQQIDFHRAGWV